MDRAMDVRLAAVLGHTRHKEQAPEYSSDIAAMYDVEEELLRRGLARQYAYTLIHVVMASYTDGDWPDFLVLHATPEQRAAAAIRVMEEGKT